MTRLTGILMLTLAFAAPATAQTTGKQPVLVSIKRMSLDTALKAAQATIEACRKEGVQIAVTVLDRGGDAQVVLRDVLAPDLTLKVSQAKAYAAMSFVTPTSQLEGRFKAPVRPGDTLRTTWTITEKLAKPKHGGGIVVLRARCENQHGDVVAEADGKMLVASRKELK